MRILLLGSSGQVGWEAQRTLAPLGEVISLDYPQVDFTHPEQVRKLVMDLRPQVIYNAVAYTAVDKAQSEPELPRLINAESVGVLAGAAFALKAVLIHFSTDYVFDGKKGSAYVESDAPAPLNVYGQSKLEGEQAIQQVGGAFLILRTAWVYSMRRDRDSFVAKVLQWAKGRPSIRVVADQVSNPTWARMLAETTAQVLARGDSDRYAWFQQRSGIYHLAGSGSASRLEWAQAILANRPAPCPAVDVQPALTSEFPTPADRPLHSVLDCSRFAQVFGMQLPPWQAALALAMQE